MTNCIKQRSQCHEKRTDTLAVSVLFLFAEVKRGFEGRGYRATVRWTVVTASDQATAVARIESLDLRQNPIEVIASVGFFLYFHAQ